ncbi:MAG: hypothetical protein M0Z61_03245 [Nitrospiraceae bacterium]|nr:hypothetical protein [Nitrospiraceae bacterium]
MRKFWAVWIAVLLFIAVLGPGTESLLAAHASDPFETAAEHAGMAARAGQLSMIHLHLQHVLNCLEGSGGGITGKWPATRAQALAPCKLCLRVLQTRFAPGRPSPWPG